MFQAAYRPHPTAWGNTPVLPLMSMMTVVVCVAAGAQKKGKKEKRKEITQLDAEGFFVCFLNPISCKGGECH